MIRRHSEWTDRLSDYLDGALDGRERRVVEEHLASCGRCRDVLEELRDVVERAASLEDREPPRDLWPGIAAVIRAPADQPARVIELPTGPAGVRASGRRVALTAPQLAAAAVALIVTSVATTWWVGPGVVSRGGEEAPRVAVGSSAAAPVAGATVLPPNLAEELADLEEVLEAARASLDPNTVRVLERNLGVIEQAIVDSQRALALDPENEFLAHHLERVVERKLAYLRDAARVIEWAG